MAPTDPNIQKTRPIGLGEPTNAKPISDMALIVNLNQDKRARTVHPREIDSPEGL